MLRQITNLSEFLVLLPKLVRLSDKLDGLWEPDMTPGTFAARIMSVFQEESAFFIEEEGDEFKYVAVLHRDAEKTWYFWLFYMNPNFRSLTKDVIQEIKAFCQSRGIQTLRFSTTRTTRSYERWVTKLGATKYAIVYQWEVQHGSLS